MEVGSCWSHPSRDDEVGVVEQVDDECGGSDGQESDYVQHYHDAIHGETGANVGVWEGQRGQVLCRAGMVRGNIDYKTLIDCKHDDSLFIHGRWFYIRLSNG